MRRLCLDTTLVLLIAVAMALPTEGFSESGFPGDSDGFPSDMPSGSGGFPSGMPSGSGGFPSGMPSGSGGFPSGFPSGMPSGSDDFPSGFPSDSNSGDLSASTGGSFAPSGDPGRPSTSGLPSGMSLPSGDSFPSGEGFPSGSDDGFPSAPGSHPFSHNPSDGGGSGMSFSEDSAFFPHSGSMGSMGSDSTLFPPSSQANPPSGMSLSSGNNWVPPTDGPTPAPTVEGQTPAPTTAGQTPAPTIEGQTPAPTTAGQTPAPTIEGQTPAPTFEGQTPLPPTPPTPALTPAPTPAGQKNKTTVFTVTPKDSTGGALTETEKTTILQKIADKLEIPVANLEVVSNSNTSELSFKVVGSNTTSTVAALQKIEEDPAQVDSLGLGTMGSAATATNNQPVEEDDSTTIFIAIGVSIGALVLIGVIGVAISCMKHDPEFDVPASGGVLAEYEMTLPPPCESGTFPVDVSTGNGQKDSAADMDEL